VTERAATILDVARVAGVSKSTVSNVVRGSAAVTGEKRRRVLAAIDQLDYRPNALARQLVQRHTNMLGVMVGDLGNPFYAEMAKLIERHAAARGYTAMFCNTLGDAKAELAAVETLLEYRVAGFVFLAYAGDASGVRGALEGRVPVVFVSCEGEWGDTVCANDFHGAELATEHLIGLGHTSIAYFSDPIVEDAVDGARRAGYRSAMAASGLPSQVFHWSPSLHLVTLDGGEAGPIEELFASPSRPSAVVSSNDLGAIDLLDFADRAGLEVPGDLSVVGFDDVMIAGMARVSLTTIRQQQEELAREGVEILAGRIEGRLEDSPGEHRVDVDLIVRGTTAPPRGA
jgi:DNA-binding LacI/PurR family transcriptional regulator